MSVSELNKQWDNKFRAGNRSLISPYALVSGHGRKELPIPTKTNLKLREYLSDKSELTENSLTSLLT
ncbi:MAG: hypothetical protein WA941_04675 [Nitrososphaeraceae archaeon]